MSTYTVTRMLTKRSSWEWRRMLTDQTQCSWNLQSQDGEDFEVRLQWNRCSMGSWSYLCRVAGVFCFEKLQTLEQCHWTAGHVMLSPWPSDTAWSMSFICWLMHHYLCYDWLLGFCERSRELSVHYQSTMSTGSSLSWWSFYVKSTNDLPPMFHLFAFLDL